MTYGREHRQLVDACRKARQRVEDMVRVLRSCDTITMTPEETEAYLHGEKLLSAINHIVNSRWEE